jgi:hypothetical protein
MRGVQDNFLANWAWMGVGAGLTWGIVLARAHYSWFILHPIGLLMWSPFVTHVFWVSIFLGWLCKGLIMRYGGADAYRRLTPAFLGLAFGDLLMMLIWAAIDAWQGRSFHFLMAG